MAKSRYKSFSDHLFSFIALIILASSIVGMLVSTSYINKEREVVHVLSFDWEIDNVESEEIYVYATPNLFLEDDTHVGIQYNMLLVNRTKYPIKDWSVAIKFHSEDYSIKTSWNGNWILGNDKLTFKPSIDHMLVPEFSERSFGLVMYAPSVFEMNEISLSYHEDRGVLTYPIFVIFLVAAIASFVAMVALESAAYKVKKYSEKHSAYRDLVSESLRTIANIIDTKDEYTKGHSVRVAIYSKMIAERMGLPDYEQERIYYIGLLHDIGKIGVPVSILTKPGRLSDEEFEIIKRHPAMGATIMKDFSSIPGVQNGIKYHHERFDGKGYNEKIAGYDIPLEGRIICVADSYDAMSSKRCYRKALAYDFILDELKRNSGTQFDPDIVKHMVSIVEEGYAPISDAEMMDYEI